MDHFHYSPSTQTVVQLVGGIAIGTNAVGAYATYSPSSLSQSNNA